MQDNFEQGQRPFASEDEVAGPLQEALALYFERLNGDEAAPDPATMLASAGPTVLAEWQAVQALLQLPQKAGPMPSVESAWQRFRVRSFAVAPAPALAEDSLGQYVAEALASNERSALKESGLARPTLEALQAEPTSLQDLKGYAFNDYVALARRYGVNDSAFPRMLKWLKGLGKNLLSPAPAAGRGLMFARDEETRTPGLTEAEMLELDKTGGEEPGPKAD